MKLKEILEILEAKTIQLSSEQFLNQDYHFVFATDLMSDALALVRSNSEETLLVTGLANIQTLRTAEVLDITSIILVRGKTLQYSEVELGSEQEFNIFTTDFTMYEACGRLYMAGLGTATK